MRAAINTFFRRIYHGRDYSWVAGPFWAAGGMIFINDNIVDVHFITGSSMAPALSPTYKETGSADVVMWRKWNATKNIKRGDVVHFMNPSRPEGFVVKRVIGVEGDVVVLDPRRRPSSREGPEPAEARAWDEWRGRAQVPQGHIWVEGDNWRDSRDSNYYGPISKSLVTGRAVALVKPVSSFWTKPWVGFQSRTRVIKGQWVRDWTEGLPVDLAEIRDPHLPP